MPSRNYNDEEDDKRLLAYIKGTDESVDTDMTETISKIMSTKTRGIEGLPYQFMENVDRRIYKTEVGRKYGEKIFSRLPLLFLTPCEPLFMDDFKKGARDNILTALIDGATDELNALLDNTTGRYYTTEYNYEEYYKYLDTMLACVASYLGIFNEKITIGGSDGEHAIGTIHWGDEMNSAFKTFFSCKENLVFYLDGMDSVSESFSNSTTQSALASQINGYSETANEIRFLFGKDGNTVAEMVNSAGELGNNITNSLGSGIKNVAGGIVNSLCDKGIHTVVNGGKIIFPEIWSDSDFSRSYNIEIKLRSPDHDKLSIFLNVIKPYCKLLALTLPRQMKADTGIDPNAYGAPFLVRAYSKGMFNIDMGMITSMSVNKGATGAWNDDGLPTQIDISLEIKDLYSHLGMSEMDNNPLSIQNVIQNTSYMDFLANMSGLNIAQMEIGRRITMAYFLSRAYMGVTPRNVFTKLEMGVSKLADRLYNTL